MQLNIVRFNVITSAHVHGYLEGYLERTPLPDGFATVDAVVDRGLIAPVGENEPITESKLAPREAGAGLPPARAR